MDKSTETQGKHYIDNLRWITLLILIPYHTAMAWNVWGEPNYIYHFIWVVLFQYILYEVIGNHTFVLFIGTVLLSYWVTLFVVK